MRSGVQEKSSDFTEKHAFYLVFLIWFLASFFCVGEAFVRGEAPGSALSEAPGHLWLLAQACEHFFSDGPFHFYLSDINYPAGQHWVLMDPINTIWGLPAYYLAGGGPQGAIWAAHSVVLCNLALAAGGAYCAGRYFGGTRSSGIVAAAILCFTPPLLGLISSGYTEKYPVGWMAFHYVALDVTMKRAAAGVRRKQLLWPVLAAGLSGIATCYAGWYMTVILWLCSGIFVLHRLFSVSGSTDEIRVARVRVLAVASIAAGIVLAALLPLIKAMHSYGSAVGRSTGISDTDVLQSQHLVESVNRVSGEIEVHSKGFELQQMLPYLNNGHAEMSQAIDPFWGAWTSGFLIVVVVWIRRSGVRASESSSLQVWGLLIGFVALMMMGHQLVFRGTPVEVFGQPVWLPVHYLAVLFPALYEVSFWGKLSGVLALQIGIFVAIIVGRMTPSKARVLVFVLPVVLLFETVISTGYVPFAVEESRRNSYSLSPSKEFRQALHELELSPELALLQLPMDNEHPTVHGTAVWPFLLWQLSHGHPVAENNLTDDSVLEILPELVSITRTIRRVDRRTLQRESGLFDLEKRLVEEGFGAVFLHLDRLPSAGQLASKNLLSGHGKMQSPTVFRRNLVAELGEPSIESDNLVVWKLKH